MTAFESTVLRELAGLPETRRAEVLAYIRFLRIGLADQKTLRRRFAAALQGARSEARKRKVTQGVIDREIKAARARK